MHSTSSDIRANPAFFCLISQGDAVIKVACCGFKKPEVLRYISERGLIRLLTPILD
jgi:hypothetical protein